MPGLFADTLPGLAGCTFVLIRLDSDSYDSVATSPECLYPLLAEGGIIIVDDWHLVGCRFSVSDFRARHNITDAVKVLGGNGYWVKTHGYGTPEKAENPSAT